MYSIMIQRVIIITSIGLGLVQDIAGSPMTANIHSTEILTELQPRGGPSVGSTIFATVVGNALGGILSPKFAALGKKSAEDAEKKKNKSQESLDENNLSSKKSKSKDESSLSDETPSRKKDKGIAEPDSLSSKDSGTSGVAKVKPLRRRNGAKIRSLERRRTNRSKLFKSSGATIGTVGTTALGAAVFNYVFSKKDAENQIKADKEAKKKSKEEEEKSVKTGSDNSSKDKVSEKPKDVSAVDSKSEPSGQVTDDKSGTELGQDDKKKLSGPS